MQGTICEGQSEQFQGLPKLLDIKELCIYFDISYKTAYSLIKSRDFPSFKVKGKYRIMLDKLPQWMEKHCRDKK